LRVQGLGFGVWGLGFGVQGLGFGVWGSGLGVQGLGFGFGNSTRGSNGLEAALVAARVYGFSGFRIFGFLETAWRLWT
jgi:hypothetical protein